jgi:hypothetical protein
MIRPCRGFLAVLLVFLAMAGAAPAASRGAEDVLRTWHAFALELVRHTPTYSPPVASRAFGYLGVIGYEAVASANSDLVSLAGQLNGLQPGPRREAGKAYDDTVVLNAALAAAIGDLFANTGPTGQRTLQRISEKLASEAADGLPSDVMARSQAFGKAVAAHVLDWSRGDGGHDIASLGFDVDGTPTVGPAAWVPTSTIALQQKPLLPKWGSNRTFAMPNGAACPLPAPAPYSEVKGSPFHREALEVHEVTRALTEEQMAIARFWSDDAMLSPTPPGHWVSIALQILERDKVSLEQSAEVLARLGIALADSFIGCWQAKYEYDLLRPVTYINRVIDPKWKPLLITPPFPEYPSGHSTESAAAAEVLTAFFGDNFAFEDATHVKDKIPPRRFASFRAAAEEAGISRLYGGIHFRAAVERGLEQGRCIGAYANELKTRR